MRERTRYERPSLVRNQNLKDMTKVAGLISTLPKGPACKPPSKLKCVRK